MIFLPIDQHAILVQVADIKETSFFAGKLGRRVTPVLTVQFEGRSYEIKMPAYHSKLAGKPALPMVGSQIRISRNQLR